MAYTTNVPLGTAVNFAVLAGSGITIAGAVNSSNVTGDIGTFPTPTITGLANLVLNGVNHAGDAVTQLAKLDLTAAYVDAAARPVTGTIATELGSTTVVPGVYDSAAGDFQITGILTIDAQGDPNSVFIFKTASTFITAPGASMSLINGAQACNVFFIVGSSATLDTTSAVSANIIALTSITLNTGATMSGRALARNGAVTLDENTITESICNNQTGGSMGLCSVQQLNDLSVCFSCLSPKQLMAIKAFAILSFADEFDPTIDDSVQGVIDAASCLGSCGSNGPTLLAADAAIWVGLANAQGAEIPTDPAALANLLIQLEQLSDEQLYGVGLLALCGTTIPAE